MIHTYRTVLGEEEQQAVRRVLDSGWLISGPEVARFEEEFAAYVGATYAVATASCTHALQLAYLTLAPRHEVALTTPLTFCATVNSLIHAGLTPEFQDVDAWGQMLPHSGRGYGLTVPVHFAGRPLSWEPSESTVVFDAAHACGGVAVGPEKGRRIGSYGDATAFSFHATKCMTTGQGGMLTTNDPEVARRARYLRIHGMTKDAFARGQERTAHYDVVEIGLKANMTDLQAAIGRVQLTKLDAMNAARRRLAIRYREALASCDRLELPPMEEGHTWHLFIVKLAPHWAEFRDAWIEDCAARGVELAVHVKPVYLMTAYRALGYAPGQCPNAEDFWRRCLTLPLYPTMTDAEQAQVIEVVTEVITHWPRRGRGAPFEP